MADFSAGQVITVCQQIQQRGISLRLDMLPDATLLDLLADSYDLTRAKIRHKLPSSDLL